MENIVKVGVLVMNEAERIKMKMKESRNKDTMFYICVVMFIALALCLGIVSYSQRYKPDSSLYASYDLSKDILPNPIQESVEKESFTVKKSGINIEITKLARYDITGKVEGIKDFSGNFLANLFSFNSENFTNFISPRDLALSWGNVALDENSNTIGADQYFFNGNRVVLFTYAYELTSKYGKEYIGTHVSNNHIITLDNDLKRELLKIKQSDVVRIIGYLVDCKADNGWSWGPSSMSREDTGCEIILAEDIVIMPKK